MNNDDYFEITSQLDAREILRYLNNLGIHNISGEVLKYFITDLKKLIKYDLQRREGVNKKETIQQGPERLHSASTISSRTRSRRTVSDICCSKESQGPKKLLDFREIHSAPNIRDSKETLQSKRVCSYITDQNKRNTLVKESKKPLPTLNNNLIKVQKQPVNKKSDPVSLYHYYTSLWEKYKPNVPGENNWSELRWSIRQKMAGSDLHSNKDSIKKPVLNKK